MTPARWTTRRFRPDSPSSQTRRWRGVPVVIVAVLAMLAGIFAIDTAGAQQPPGTAVIRNPLPGGELCTGDIIRWSGPDGGRYKVRIGTTLDGTEVMNTGTANKEIKAVMLPVGEPLFVSLRHKPDGGSWELQDQVTYVACTTPRLITQPTDELCTGNLIAWSGPAEGRYKVRIGTTPDGKEVMNRGTSSTDITAVPVPPDVMLYVSLRHRPDGGSWTLHDQAEFDPCSNPIEIIPEFPDLCPFDVIRWTGPTTGRYKVRIGSTPDGTDLFNRGADPGTTEIDLDGADLGSWPTLYLSLRHKEDGASWTLHDTRDYLECTVPPGALLPEGARARIDE